MRSQKGQNSSEETEKEVSKVTVSEECFCFMEKCLMTKSYDINSFQDYPLLVNTKK